MNRPWRILESLLLAEARDAQYYRDQLFKLVQRKYGDNELDKLTQGMQQMPPDEFRQFVELYFVDPEVDELAGRMVDQAIAQHPEKSGLGHAPKPTHSRSTDKGSLKAEPIPARPRPGDVSSPLHGPPRTAVVPGEKPAHAVGSAGQHRPKEPAYLRPGITSGPKTSAGVTPQKHDPERDPKSGIVAAQREADRMYKAGDKAGAAKMAAQLGVPPPEERFHYDSSGRMSRDPAGNPKIVVWSPDRVFRWRKGEDAPVAGDDPGALASAPGFLRGVASRAGDERAVSLRGAEAKPRPEKPDRLDLIKRGLVKRNVASSPDVERKGPDRPPSFDGEVWRPHGRSGEERTKRPDPVTGDFVYGKRQVDPSKTGEILVGYGDRWYTPSEYAALRARAAGVQQRPASDKPWRAWQHPPRRGVHAGPTPASAPRRPPPRPEPPEEPENPFDEEEPTEPGAPSFRDDDE